MSTELYQNWKENSKDYVAQNKEFYQQLRKKKKLDDEFHVLDAKVFEKMDCLDCANCCSTTSPIFYDKDVERMAAHFKVKSADFFDQYLRIDEDGDQVLKSSPCPFLMDDNKCMAYESRPKACREYPHTNRKRMHQIMDLTAKNTRICPAVAHILERMVNK